MRLQHHAHPVVVAGVVREDLSPPHPHHATHALRGRERTREVRREEDCGRRGQGGDYIIYYGGREEQYRTNVGKYAENKEHI